MEKGEIGEKNAVASSEMGQSLAEGAERASESQGSSESEHLSRTHGIDSGIAESSDHSTADSPSLRRSPSPSPERGASEVAGLECEAQVSNQQDSHWDLPPSLNVLHSKPDDDNTLTGCLEPRPPHEEDDGGTSPKVIQQNLLRKVHQMNTNGSQDGDHVQEGKMDEKMGALRISIPEREDKDTVELNPGPVVQPRRSSVFSVFKRKHASGTDQACQTMVAAGSTTGLILQDRPKDLPAKSLSEEKRHQKMYEQMVTAARKKEMQQAKELMKQEKRKQERDKMIAGDLAQWAQILPRFSALRHTRRVRDLWWRGLPPGVRGEVWRSAIGNDLNISPTLYEICLKRCKERLALAGQRSRSDSVASSKSLSREHSVEVIHLDILRTFPTLGFFQEGGPFHQTLHDVLGAYACYRPDVGYVQGMSFLAAVLLLNIDAADAFVCLANLINRPSYLAFFRVEHELMKPYFNAFSALLKEHLPCMYDLFQQLSFSPEFYLIEWIFTIYTRVLPLDVACRVWDMFCRDGDVFLYRTALGILHMYQSELIQLTSIEDVGQFLGRLPASLDSNILFHHISAISISNKKFSQILVHYK